MRRKTCSVFILMLVCLCTRAQTKGYLYSASLDTVEISGFYNILLTPELTAHLKTDLSDIRIVNAAGKWVPHIIRTPQNEIARDAVIWNVKFRITENTREKTEIIAERNDGPVSNLILSMRNSAAERFATLAGSDDQQGWFVISDSILVNPTPDERKATIRFVINIPKSSYKFFKLTVKNNNKDPFDINDISTAGALQGSRFPPDSFIQNPPTIIHQKDSGRFSYIRVVQTQPFHFNSIQLEIAGAKYFNRAAEIYIPADSSSSFAPPGRIAVSLQLSNNSTLHFNFSTSNAKVFYILIHNEDNLPLIIQRVSTINAYSFISSFLEANNSYSLLLDNPIAMLPQYDLSQADRNIMDSGTFIKPGKIIAQEKMQVAHAENNNKYVLWAAIIGSLIVLLFFTLRMTKEINKNRP